jgi:hypothetical protein
LILAGDRRIALSEQQKSELSAHLEKIDAELTAKHVPIPARALVTILTYQNALGVTFLFPSETSNYVNEWYTKKYGPVSNSSSIGLSVVCISGHVFAVELPIAFGHCAIQPLQHINSLTKEIWQAQSNDDQTRIEETAFELIRRFQVIASHLEIIGGDLMASATHLLGPSGDYGLSKWASFQAVEKLIKTSLQKRSIPYKRNHNLEELLSLASANGLPAIPEALSAKIKTTAGVRYGERKIDLKDAINAHYSSIVICATLADPKDEHGLQAVPIEYL